MFTPELNFTGNFLWAATRKKIFTVKNAFARNINKKKFLKNQKFQKIEKKQNRCKKYWIGSKRLKIGGNHFFYV